MISEEESLNDDHEEFAGDVLHVEAQLKEEREEDVREPEVINLLSDMDTDDE